MELLLARAPEALYTSGWGWLIVVPLVAAVAAVLVRCYDAWSLETQATHE